MSKKKLEEIGVNLNKLYNLMKSYLTNCKTRDTFEAKRKGNKSDILKLVKHEECEGDVKDLHLNVYNKSRKSYDVNEETLKKMFPDKFKHWKQINELLESISDKNQSPFFTETGESSWMEFRISDAEEK